MPLRVKIACLCALAIALVAGWFALRDSGVFSVDHVAIEGLSPNALPAITEALDAAARSQTTTDFSLDSVRAAVAQYTLISDVRAETHVPHGVTLIVSERDPVAQLEVGPEVIPIAADGSVISGLARLPRLAAVRSTHLPVAGRERDPWVALALRVLTDAPLPLRRRVVSITLTGDGLTVHLHRGPRLIFGDATLPHAKWDAAAAVLADPSSQGASLVDVRLPSRPAAQVADAGTTAAATGAPGTTAGPPLGAATVATMAGQSQGQP